MANSETMPDAAAQEKAPREVVYDEAGDAPMANDGDAPGGMGCGAGVAGVPAEGESKAKGGELPVLDGDGVNMAATQGDGLGCHAGKETMLEAAKAAGKSEILEQYAADYPTGPHDQPQSMCPAFGSLRVGSACAAPRRSSAARPAACTA
jgi:chlorophyllide a reductase subunit Y